MDANKAKQLLQLAGVFFDHDEDEPDEPDLSQCINLNDVFGWACADAEKVQQLKKDIAEHLAKQSVAVDPVNHPPHYNQHPSGVECIQITEHMNFCLGNAVKYLWRADLKADAIEDLEKAVWYIEREIHRRKANG